MQTHLLVCEERQRQCRVNGCHFAGNFKEMEQHNKDQAEKHVSLLTEMGEKLLDVLLKKDTNDLTKTKMALGGFCWSIFNFKQMAADMLQAGNTAEPMASGVYEFEECSWRMLLYVRRTKCKLFLQLHRAVHPVRASFRIVIGLANPVVIELEPDLRLREGETFGTEVALAKLEREAEKNSGWLFMEIFIERFSFSL